MTASRDSMPWVWRGSALAALVLGWVFITWQNHFRISAPVVFVCLAYLAVIATIYYLWRTGAAAVADRDDDDDSTWAKPAGALGELEREKRTLLKAIKEAEFDHQMGKLSKHDVDDMVRTYRARAIEVIKDIDRLGHGAVGTPREQIMREVRARLEIEARSQKKSAEGKAKADGVQSKKTKGARIKDTREAALEAAVASAEAATGVAAGADAASADAASAAGSDDGDAAAAAAAPPDGANHAEPPAVAEAEARAPEPRRADQADDEAMDADSTTAHEPTRDDPAKEATP